AVDFLRPRCAPPKERRITRRTLVIAACAAAIAGAVAYSLVDTERREASLAELKDRLLRMGPDVEEAESFVKNNKRLILGWYDARPRPLELLKRVTTAFPERGTVWATSLTLSESGKGTLSGKAADQKSVLAVLDRLKGDAAFTEVMLSDMREASGGAGGVSFALTFSSRGAE
ncbi:MAG: PilN domain-containing protein, partial [Planctomycetota bacterium]